MAGCRGGIEGRVDDCTGGGADGARLQVAAGKATLQPLAHGRVPFGGGARPKLSLRPWLQRN